MEEKPELAQTVKQQLGEIRQCWVELESATQAKAQQLLEATKADRLVQNYVDLDKRLLRLETQLQGVAAGPDLLSVNSSLKKLQVGLSQRRGFHRGGWQQRKGGPRAEQFPGSMASFGKEGRGTPPGSAPSNIPSSVQPGFCELCQYPGWGATASLTAGGGGGAASLDPPSLAAAGEEEVRLHSEEGMVVILGTAWRVAPHPLSFGPHAWHCKSPGTNPQACTPPGGRGVSPCSGGLIALCCSPGGGLRLAPESLFALLFNTEASQGQVAQQGEGLAGAPPHPLFLLKGPWSVGGFPPPQSAAATSPAG